MPPRPDKDHKERLQQENIYQNDIIHNFHAVIGTFLNVVVLDFQFPERQDIVGVHVYRSFDSDQDGFELITPEPIGSTRWVDSPQLSLREEITPLSVSIQDQPKKQLCFELPEVVYAPVGLTRMGFRQSAEPAPLHGTFNFFDVDRFLRLYYRGEEVWAGEVGVDGKHFYLPLTSIPDDLVERYRNFEADLDPNNWSFTYFVSQKIPPLHHAFYRAVLVSSAGYEITPLLKSPIAMVDGEKISWIWRSALQRNQWLIDHEGEQVQLFLRRWSGELCACQSDRYFDLRCEKCFGIGYVGGYYGPYHFQLALEDSIDEDIDRQDNGYRRTASSRVWSIPFPLVRTGDVIVRVNGLRQVVGAVTNTTASGSVIQQAFPLETAHSGKFIIPSFNSPIIISKYGEHCLAERSISKKFQSITY